MEIAADIALPEGAFTMELTEEQICLILWGSQEAMAQAHEKVKTGNVPWLLNWDGYSISGTAIYAGTGELWQATLRGTSPEGGEFTITLAPGELPLTCVVTVDDTGKSVMEGVEVEARQVRYDRDGDGQEESVYESAFLAHGVGVRAEFVTRQDSLLSDLFINWAIRWSEGGLSLNHLLTTEAPAFRSVDFKTLNQARAEAEFSPYLPQGDPEGYGEFYGHLTWQEGIQNRMFVRWSRGYDDVAVWVERPERGEDHDTVGCGGPGAVRCPAVFHPLVRLGAMGAGQYAQLSHLPGGGPVPWDRRGSGAGEGYGRQQLPIPGAPPGRHPGGVSLLRTHRGPDVVSGIRDSLLKKGKENGKDRRDMRQRMPRRPFPAVLALGKRLERERLLWYNIAKQLRDQIWFFRL